MTPKRPRKAPAEAGADPELDEAIRLTLQAIEKDPDKVSDPTLPLYQHVAKDNLEEERRRYEEGDKNALMGAIRICANSRLPMPEWVATEFIAAYDKVLNCRSGSWDEVFGRPYKKGTHLAALRKRRRGRIQVMLEVRAAKARGESINFGLFEKIGKKLGFGRSLTQELYADAKSRWPHFAKSVPEDFEK